MNSNEANIPGAAGIIRIHGGNAFYCTVCKIEIQPLMVEIDGDEIPTCEECALEDMIESGEEIKQAITIEEELDSSVGEHDIPKDTSWDECYT